METAKRNHLEVREISGDYRPATEQEILAAAEKVINSKFRRGARIQDPENSKALFQQKLALQNHEVFAVLFLDARHRVIEYRELFHGSIASATVHPRLVAKQALDLNAAAVIVAHNHPSGEIEPSRQDIDLTKRLKEALNLVDVNLLDHLIIGSVNSFSFVERSYL